MEPESSDVSLAASDAVRHCCQSRTTYFFCVFRVSGVLIGRLVQDMSVK